MPYSYWSGAKFCSLAVNTNSISYSAGLCNKKSAKKKPLPEVGRGGAPSVTSVYMAAMESVEVCAASNVVSDMGSDVGGVVRIETRIGGEVSYIIFLIIPLRFSKGRLRQRNVARPH